MSLLPEPFDFGHQIKSQEYTKKGENCLEQLQEEMMMLPQYVIHSKWESSVTKKENTRDSVHRSVSDTTRQGTARMSCLGDKVTVTKELLFEDDPAKFLRQRKKETITYFFSFLQVRVIIFVGQRNFQETGSRLT